ncbi:MAG TPA: M23 family metallopeptidase [Candidatus Paceibacterota bacterium]|nr:M23 family metallopeptidase [Candidatus Paceibacterota bacterium]
MLAPRASAFWPFYAPAAAEGNGAIPSSATPVLAAAINLNPDPTQGPASSDLSGDDSLVPHAGPEGVASPDSTVTPAESRISTYLVRAGDTLSEIAQSYGVSVNTIIWANNLSGKTIHPGETLVILPVTGVEHTVLKGETLASLAKKYGASAQDIADYNGLSGGALAAGTTIIIPNGELAAAPAAPAQGSSAASVRAASAGSNTTGNPYRGGSGAEIDGYYENPVPGALLSQGLHGENAVDLAIARGTAIHAAAAGTVIVAKNNGAWNGGYGNYVVIAHANGTQTLYAHMKDGGVAVSVGQSVGQGQVIGYVGTTGDATGPHVHFEIRGALNPFGLCSLDSRPGLFSCGG